MHKITLRRFILDVAAVLEYVRLSNSLVCFASVRMLGCVRCAQQTTAHLLTGPKFGMFRIYNVVSLGYVCAVEFCASTCSVEQCLAVGTILRFNVSVGV
jgi:hypothetical protein